MAEGPAHTGDAEREHDVLDRAAVPRFDDPADELLHLGRFDLALDGAPEDLLGGQFRVARPTGRVHQRHVEALDDLPVGKQEGGLHPELVTTGIARDAGLLARGRIRRHDGQSSRSGQAGPAPTTGLPEARSLASTPWNQYQ